MEKKKATKKQPSHEDKCKELTETLQRLQAEFENFRKRSEKEKAELAQYSTAKFIEKLLPVVDSFEMAIKSDDNKEGVKLIYGQLVDLLEKEGVKPIETVGTSFDPYKHEVLLTEKTKNKEEDDKICEELQKGFMFKEKVLRYAKVKVKKHDAN